MIDDRERQEVLEMIAAGKLSPEDGLQVLLALDRKRRPGWGWLLSAVDQLGLGGRLALSVITAIGAIMLGYARIRFDGALDMHVVANRPSWDVALYELLVGWPVPAALYWAASRAFAWRGKLVEFVAIVGIARVPMVVAAAVIAATLRVIPASVPWLVMSIMIAVSLAALSLTIALLATGYRAESALERGRLVATFTIALIAGELVSKLVLFYLV